MTAQRSLRIAIAEDEFLLAESLRRLVEAGGTDWSGRGDGRRRPDLALVDVQLARGSSGLDAAAVIKERHGVPAIAVTANPDEERARKAGLLGLVPKPDASAVLATVLRAAAEWLEKGRVEESSCRFFRRAMNAAPPPQVISSAAAAARPQAHAGPDGSAIVPIFKPQPDGTLAKALARAWRWQRMLDSSSET